jgi:hypothetical protein
LLLSETPAFHGISIWHKLHPDLEAPKKAIQTALSASANAFPTPNPPCTNTIACDYEDSHPSAE